MEEDQGRKIRGFGEVTPFFSQPCAVVLCESTTRHFRRLCMVTKWHQLASSYPSVCSSVCPSVSAPFPLDGVPQSFIFGIYMKICRETPNFVQIGRKDRALYMET